MSELEDRYRMNLKDWPHRFSKDGEPKVIGKDELTGDPIMAASMVCIDCHIRFVSGQTPRPPDPCPARNEKKEMRRLLS